MSLPAETGSAGTLVSVVVPTHNRAPLLVRALRSALAQTHRNLEVIVVDDASNDETPHRVRDFHDARIRYLRHEVNRGGGATRNTGVRAARGEYIAFLDDDDEWSPAKIERQLQSIAGHGAVICGFMLDAGHGAVPGTRTRGSRTVVTPAMLRRTVVGWGASTFMVSSAIARTVEFDEELASGQDWDFLIRVFAEHRILYIDDPLVTFHVGAHPRITSGNVEAPPAQLEKRLRIFYKHRDFFGRFWFNYHIAGRLLYRVRQRRNALRQVASAVRRCGVLPVVFGFLARFYQKNFGY